MSTLQIPKGWKKNDSISDVLSVFETGSRPKGGISNINYGIPNLGGEHIGNNGKLNLSQMKFVPNDFFESMKKGIIKKNDILMVKDGYTGRTSFVDDSFSFKKASVSEHVYILRPTSEILPKFLFYFLRSPFSQSIIKNHTKGIIAGLNMKFVNDFPIIFPTDQKIQQKIIDKLDYLLDTLNKKKKKIFEQQEKNILLLENLLGNKKGRKRQLTIKDYMIDKMMDSIISKCKLESSSHHFEELINCCNDIVDTPHSTVKYFDSGIPVIRTSNLEPYLINFLNTKFTSNEIYLERMKKIDPRLGDVLYSREAPWGIAAEVKDEKFVVGQRILLLRPNPKKIHGDFLTLVLNSSFGYNQAKSVVNETTSGHVNIRDIKKFKIPLIPESEQEKIKNKIKEKIFLCSEIEDKLLITISKQNKLLDDIKQLDLTFLNSAFTEKFVN